jgi:hypothetical protein
VNAVDPNLEHALQRFREASNPAGGEKERVRLALHAASLAQNAAGGSQPVLPGSELQTRKLGRPAADSKLVKMLSYGLAFGLVMFGAGFVIGQRAGELGTPSRAEAPRVIAPPLSAPVAPSLPVRAASEAPAGTPPTQPVPAEPSPFRAPRIASPESGPKPRATRAASRKAPARKLTMAQVLQQLHRADRAIYSGQAPWALHLLDDLDERADRAMLREERVATRVLALCRDGQVESAERVAAEARRESPTSIYGALLDRGCSASQDLPAASPLDRQSKQP